MDNIQLSHIKHIQQAQREGRLVLFVGAGVSRNSGIPTWNDLINKMREELPNTLSNETDALKLAQLYKDSRGHKEYMDKVKEVLLYNKAVPNKLHKKILSLKPCHIITTNYDDLIEQEIRNEFALYDVICEDKDITQMSYPNALIKMHGDYSTDNIVLTENDYYNYAKNFPLIRALVQSIFASKLVLFIGFSFADLNLKMIMNELKNILSENMQRAYIISTDKPDKLTIKYFENKGINIVYLEEPEIKTLAGKKYINNQKNNKGILLENILTAISSNKEIVNNDLATYLYKKIVGYQSEIRSFGDGLRYLFPEYKNIHWHTHSDGLQTFSDYFIQLSQELKTDSDKRKFLREHPEIDLRTLLKIAYHNYLGEIDGITILDEKFCQNVDSYIDPTIIDYIRDFDFKATKERLSYLHSRSIDYTISDLEYPFYLYYVGKYWEAYKYYSSLLTKYWNKQKYILYFICRYNMSSIKNGVRYQKNLDEDFNSEIDLVLTNDNLDDILNKLPLNEEIRRLLGDIITYRQVGNSLQKTYKLREDIYAQRKSSLKGGCSLNSNITNLLAAHHRERLFWNSNFIVSNNNSYYSALCYNMALSILNSISTKAGYFFGQKMDGTKIKELDTSLVKLLLFEIPSKDLNVIFDAYEINDIVLSNDAVEFIQTRIMNLAKDNDNSYDKEDLVFLPLENLIILLLATNKCKFDFNFLYDLLLKFWRPISPFTAKNITALIERHNPSIDRAEMLLNKMINDNRNNADFNRAILTLANLMKNENRTINDVNLDFLSTNDKIITATLLYPIVPQKTQTEIKQFCLSNTCSLYEYLYFINHNQIDIEDAAKLEELIKKDKVSEYECNLLSKIRNNEKYKILHNLIDEHAKENKCLQFFLTPNEFDDIDNFDVYWVFTLYTKTEDRMDFFKQNKYRQKLKDFINSNYWSTEDREYLINLL